MKDILHDTSGAAVFVPGDRAVLYMQKDPQTLLADKPQLEKIIESGNLAIIREWLKQKIHKKGRLLSVPDLVKEVTGEGLNPTVFLKYLKQKYRKQLT